MKIYIARTGCLFLRRFREESMFQTKIKVGSYYELRWKGKTITFGVMYGFKDGKNKDVYALMIYTKEKVFEFPVREQLFSQWVKEELVREISWDEALSTTL
jgi:hypothetical protein